MRHQRGKKGGRGGTKKHGRNRVKCERYRRLGRREFNKAQRVAAQRRWEAVMGVYSTYAAPIFFQIQGKRIWRRLSLEIGSLLGATLRSKELPF